MVWAVELERVEAVVSLGGKTLVEIAAETTIHVLKFLPKLVSLTFAIHGRDVNLVLLRVEKEIETALEKERQEKRVTLFPIRLDDGVMNIKNGWLADVRRTRHIGDSQALLKPFLNIHMFDTSKGA